MNDPIYTAINALDAAQTSINKLSQNLSNMNSISYKKEYVDFKEVAYSQGVESQKSVSANVKTDYSQGNLTATGNPFNVAIDGVGFMEVTNSSGEVYLTRKGTLEIDESGYLSVDGLYRLASEIQVPTDLKNLSISSDGSVGGLIDGVGAVSLGKVSLYDFDEALLIRESNGLYRVESNSNSLNAGEKVNSNIIQGYLELSNVDMTSELMEMVLAQSMFQANAKVFQVSDEIIDDVNSLLKV
ncbi:MAG: flagellar hook basal-body protein [Cycloclasticus sp.]